MLASTTKVAWVGSVVEVERRVLPEAAAPAREGMGGAVPRVPARRETTPNPANLGSGTNGPDGAKGEMFVIAVKNLDPYF
ncbi:hypothetical protein ACVWZ6_001756 [Bradyrhizobium sp. GM6.1]